MLSLKNIIDNLPSAVLVFNTDRRAIMVNKMAQALVGAPEDDLVGKCGGDLVALDEKPGQRQEAHVLGADGKAPGKGENITAEFFDG